MCGSHGGSENCMAVNGVFSFAAQARSSPYQSRLARGAAPGARRLANFSRASGR